MKSFSGELGLRIGSGLVLALLALGSAWLGGYAFELFWLIAGMLVLHEWMKIQKVEPWCARATIVAATIAFFVAIFLIDQAEDRGAMPSPVIFLPVVLATVFAFVLRGGDFKARIWFSSGILYASGTLIPPVVLRLHPSDGGVAIIWLFVCVWVSDIGAFFVGRKLGGPKLWPRLSPKKTWSGFIGGLLTGSICAIGMVLYARSLWGDVWFGGLVLVVLSICAVLAAVAGDLFESAVKRRFGVKDSGSILPGHGGVMDRLDSFIFASIFTFAVVWVRGFL